MWSCTHELVLLHSITIHYHMHSGHGPIDTNFVMLVGVPLDSKDTEDSFAEFNRFVVLTTSMYKYV